MEHRPLFFKCCFVFIRIKGFRIFFNFFTIPEQITNNKYGTDDTSAYSPIKTRPSIKVVPAALEAMTTENGLIVENVLPTELAKKIAPTETIESYPSAINIGTSTG